MRKIKDNLGTFIITLVIILIPMLVGLILWNRLPDEIATHWGPDGNPNGYSSRAFAVFIMPVLFLGLHLLACFTVANKASNAISDKMFCIILWICPAMSVAIAISIYATALGYEMNVLFLALLILGIIYIVLGNYMPKVRQNRYWGMRVKWTLESKKNWEHTNRFSAKILVALGFVCIVCAMLELLVEMKTVLVVIFIGSLMCAIFASSLYSYLYYLKHNQDEDY